MAHSDVPEDYWDIGSLSTPTPSDTHTHTHTAILPKSLLSWCLETSWELLKMQWLLDSEDDKAYNNMKSIISLPPDFFGIKVSMICFPFLDCSYFLHGFCFLFLFFFKILYPENGLFFNWWNLLSIDEWTDHRPAVDCLLHSFLLIV